MKRFFALLLLTLALSSCDDGDLTQVSFEFNDAPATACNTNTDNFFIFKTQDKRTLIVQLPESNFPNRISADEPNQFVPLTINKGSIRLIYREYSGEVSQSTICSVVPAASPVVVDEREASEGKITITTTAIKSVPNSNGATQITSYLHTLVFTDLKFDLGDGASQINEAFTQITYQTDATDFINFAALPLVNRCSNANTVLFKFQNTQSLVLNLSVADAAALFTSEAGPKTILLSNDSTLKHRFYITTLTSLTFPYFCADPIPATPPVAETFTAVNGVLNQSGIIKVTTLPSDLGSKHTIVLENVQLANGTLNVQMGNTFIFGEIETTN